MDPSEERQRRKRPESYVIRRKREIPSSSCAEERFEPSLSSETG